MVRGAEAIFDIDLRAEQFARNPYSIYRVLREQFPVCQVTDGTYLLSRYEDVKFALKHFDLFASGWSNAPQAHPQWIRSDYKRADFLTETDPPEHDIYNAIVNKSFVRQAVNALEPLLRETACSALKKMQQRDGNYDFLSDFAYPLAGAALGRITGLEISSQLQRARSWIDLAESFTDLSPPPAQKLHMEKIILDQHNYYDEIINERRRNPKNDLATMLAQAEIDGEKLTSQQLHTALNVFTVAGFQAPAQQLAFAVGLLKQRADLTAALQFEPKKIDDFFEELLRFDNPTLGVMRRATTAIELHGAIIPAGAKVLLLVGAANRDPEQFPNPDLFELQRANIRSHLGFGHGPHTCLGAALARLEMKIGLEILLPHLNSINWPAAADLSWRSTVVGRILRSLPMRFQQVLQPVS
jgi:cytochrome P450